MPASLKIGDRVRLSGGYDFEPTWLKDRQFYDGTVTAFIPGQNDKEAMLVILNDELAFDPISGKHVVLELRYKGAAWTSGATVHIELCDFFPEAKTWQDRRKGKWIESNATLQMLQE